MYSPEELYVRQAAIQRGLDPELAVSVWVQESSKSTDPTLKHPVLPEGQWEGHYGRGPWGIMSFHGEIPDTFEGQTDWALDHLVEVGLRGYYGEGAPVVPGHPTTDEYVSQVMGRVNGDDGALMERLGINASAFDQPPNYRLEPLASLEPLESEMFDITVPPVMPLQQPMPGSPGGGMPAQPETAWDRLNAGMGDFLRGVGAASKGEYEEYMEAKRLEDAAKLQHQNEVLELKKRSMELNRMQALESALPGLRAQFAKKYRDAGNFGMAQAIDQGVFDEQILAQHAPITGKDRYITTDNGVFDTVTQTIVEGTGKQAAGLGRWESWKDVEKASSSMRKEYRKIIQPYLESMEAFEKVQSAVQKGGFSAMTGADDIKLVFSYMRALDPDSTVREGEYATASNAAGVPGEIRTIWNNLRGQGVLGETAREQLYMAMVPLYTQSREKYKTEFGRYTKWAEFSDLPGFLVVGENRGFADPWLPGSSIPPDGPAEEIPQEQLEQEYNEDFAPRRTRRGTR